MQEPLPLSNRRGGTAVTVVASMMACLAVAGCSPEQRAPEHVLNPPAAAPAAAGAHATAPLAPDDGQWVRPSKDYAALRYSQLTEITAANVAKLQPAWTFSTSVLRGHEEAPLVVGGTMYIVTPFPNRLYALDLTKAGAPKKWTYESNPESAAQGVACCDVVNRGAVYADGKVVFNTLDDNVVAVDASSGKEVWKTKVGEINRGETMTMAPLIVKDRVIVGNSGGEMGVRGWLKGLNLADGKVVWTAYGAGPDSATLIGPRFKPFYASDSGKNLGETTWPGTAWQTGGATAWGWVSYDPDLDLIYYGTGNPGPWNPEQRPGANKWSSTMFARDPDDGQAVWAYQKSPHDLHDYDGVNEAVLVDLPWKGVTRKVMLHPDRNGYMYVIDRTNGEVLSANAFVHITTTRGVDLKTGQLIYEPSKEPKVGEIIRDICPASPGGKDWQPSAFSPRTGLLYLPHQNMCEDVESLEANYIEGTPYVGMNVKMHAGPGGNRGEFTAWDPIAGRPVWTKTESFPVWSGALVTAGDVAFYGTMDGWFKAVDARTGADLWKYKVGSGIIGQPITYRGPDGKQYVAIMSGVGGWSGAIVAGDLDKRDSTGALGFVGAMTDLPDATQKGGTLYVFALP